MTRDQKIVATGAASGIVGMALAVWGLSSAIEPPALADTAADRIAYALRWAVVAILPYFAMVAAVGNARFLSEAIDPTLGKESQAMIVNGRVADNTLQQYRAVPGRHARAGGDSADRPPEHRRGSRDHLRGVPDRLLDRLSHQAALSRSGLLLDRLHEPRHAARDSLAVAAGADRPARTGRAVRAVHPSIVADGCAALPNNTAGTLEAIARIAT